MSMIGAERLILLCCILFAKISGLAFMNIKLLVICAQSNFLAVHVIRVLSAF